MCQSLLKFLAEAHRGVHGFVIDENGNPIERASVKIKSRDISFLTTKYGEFWRILLPGLYKLEVRSTRAEDRLFFLFNSSYYKDEIRSRGPGREPAYDVLRLSSFKADSPISIPQRPSTLSNLHVPLTNVFHFNLLFIFFFSKQVYANGYAPREVEFMVIEQHPTLLNVTLHSTKVSRRSLRFSPDVDGHHFYRIYLESEFPYERFRATKKTHRFFLPVLLSTSHRWLA